MFQSFHYVIGALFPTTADGDINALLASNLVLRDDGTIVQAKSRRSSKSRNAKLDVDLDITSNPVRIPGLDRFLKQWLIPQLTTVQVDPEEGNIDLDGNSLFNQTVASIVENYTSNPRNSSMYDAVGLGYRGPGSEHASTDDDYWNANGVDDSELVDPYYQDLQDPANYAPALIWSRYKGQSEVVSDYDPGALRQQLEALLNPDREPDPDYWYPVMLYTYGVSGQGTSYPAPVIFVEPGSSINLDFANKISIPGFSEKELQLATLVPNSSQSGNESGGLGGVFSTNYHLHGSHTNPGGFGDNVVARYTTGQRWTTQIKLPEDHGVGSYWYHSHYHPAVNQQVYGGQSGFMQIGDPFSKVSSLQDIPRNLAVIKAMQVGIDPDTAEIKLASLSGNYPSQVQMVSVNGEFQPIAQVANSGWQALTLSNQDNQAFFNISLINTAADGSKVALPLYIYGEDGHQYPEIREATGPIGGTPINGVSNSGNWDQSDPPTAFAQAKNLIALSPGKRVDVLFYLPVGTTELASTYTFDLGDDTYGVNNNDGEWTDYSSENALGLTSATSNFGQLATFEVAAGVPLPDQATLDSFIGQANQEIEVQVITPETTAAQYDSKKVPSVNLFAKQKDGEDVWSPIRRREINFTINTLVGPQDEYDAATQEALEDVDYKSYTPLPNPWLGYQSPLLINDHVFPSGNLIISQIGTIEEWQLVNWSATGLSGNWTGNSPDDGGYVGHPFHIHINDYQVKDSDTELADKRSLEDVTMINSSGYDYWDVTTNSRKTLAPLKGGYRGLPEALDPALVSSLATFGANDQTVRMLFQDYIGTYVYHCHILNHEDAGMMQVVTVVENTDSSWLVPAEGFALTAQQQAPGAGPSIRLHRAQDFSSEMLMPRLKNGQVPQRAQVGDLTADYVQDIVLSSAVRSGPGLVQIFDGAALQQGQSRQLSSLRPYRKSSLAPWAFAEDFSGDADRDLLTFGFGEKQTGSINLEDLRLTAWRSGNYGRRWKAEFSVDPFDSIPVDLDHGPHSLRPKPGLTAQQLGVTMADMNLDNFQDVVIAYAVAGGLRLVVLDGAALSLQYQTGTLEGGYFPNQNVLADALLLDASISDLSRLVLTAGFNSYAQSALENVVITTQSSAGSQQFTVQLQAGHFIATSLPGEEGGDGGDGGDGGHGSHCSHCSHGGMVPMDDRIMNLRDTSIPLILVEQLELPDGTAAATPALSGALAAGGLLVGDRLSLAQGNAANGNPANSSELIDSTQQLVLDLASLERVEIDDLTGIINSTLTSTFSASELRARNQLTALTYQAYTGGCLDPSNQAALAASILGQGLNAAQLAQALLEDPRASQAIAAYYGGSLEDLPVATIVTAAMRSLYGRPPTAPELAEWQTAVAEGLDQTLLPLAILQNTGDPDQYRVALLSAAAQWNQAQWGTTANVVGSFGQGLQSEVVRYGLQDHALSAVGVLDSWGEAQAAFAAYTDASLALLVGTPVSDTGFF